MQDSADENPIAAAKPNTNAEPPHHNLLSLNTLWGRGLIDKDSYEAAKAILPESPDFEVGDWAREIGGPAAAYMWMLDQKLLTREEFDQTKAAWVRHYTDNPYEDDNNAMQLLHILYVVDTQLRGDAPDQGTSSTAREKKTHSWILPPLAGAIAIGIWYFTAPDAVPSCQSADVQISLTKMLVGASSIAYLNNKTGAPWKSASIQSISEVGYDRSSHIRGCIVNLKSWDGPDAVGFLLSRTEDEPFPRQNDNGGPIRLRTSSPEVVREMFGKK